MNNDVLTPVGNRRSLGHGEIDIWIVRDQDIHDGEVLDRFWRSLNKVEQEKKNSFHFENRKHQYLVTRGLLRHILTFYDHSLSPSEWQFKDNAYGRPYISNSREKSDLFFNISHTENMIVIAVSHMDRVGVDVEWALKGGKTIEIIDRFFTPSEISDLKRLSTNNQKSRFFTLWTLKEAYIKACGKGLSIPLDAFSYIFSGSRVKISFTGDYKGDASSWLFWHFLHEHVYPMSVAVGDIYQLQKKPRLSFLMLDQGRFVRSVLLNAIFSTDAVGNHLEI